MRIVLVSRSEPLEQMMSYVVERGNDIEVVGEADDIVEAGQIVAQEHPEWLFLLADSHSDMEAQLKEVRAGYTALNIAAFEEGGQQVRIMYGDQPGDGKGSRDQNWQTMPVSEFVASLTKEAVAEPEETPRLTDKEEHQA